MATGMAGFEISARPDPDIFSDATVPTSLEAGGFDIALFAWVGSPFRTATASIYQSLEAQGGIQGQNYSHGGNPEVDASWPTPQPCRGSRTTPPSPVHCGTARGGRSAELPGRTSRRDPHHPAVRPP